MSKTTANDILALTAKYLRENSTTTVKNEQVEQLQPTNQPTDKIIQQSQPIQKVNIKASDKENSKNKFRSITTNELSKRISKKNSLLCQINDPPVGSNFFYEEYKEYNGCHSAAWQIEQSWNNLLKATVLAFAYHVPLRLKPDHILYAILSGFNIWTNEQGGHTKLVSKNLVDPDKKDICVEIAMNPNWSEAIDDLGIKLEEAILNKDLIQIMKAAFTTTTPVIQQVKNLTIASIMKKFINIQFSTMCGIPYITLEGAPEDWEKLKVVSNALLSLADGELNWWLEPLNKALDTMIQTSKGEKLEKEWTNFLNFGSHSGSHGCGGWINSFFPFIKESWRESNIVPNRLLKPVEKVRYHGNMVDFSYFLPTISQEEYNWTVLGKPYKTLVVTTGLVDVIQWTSEDYAIEPFMGYQIDSKN
jgi:hypothetical protein